MLNFRLRPPIQIAALAIVASSVGLVGCDRTQMVYTTRLPANVRSTPQLKGLIYNLPVAEIPISIAGGIDIDEATLSDGSSKKRTTGAADPPDRPKPRLSAPTVDVVVTSSPLVTQNNETSASTTKPPANRPEKNSVYSIKVTIAAPVYIPDHTAQLVLNYSTNPWYDTTVSLHIKNGLLTTSSADAVDQTPAIIESVAETVADAAKFAVRKTPGKSKLPCDLPRISQNASLIPQLKQSPFGANEMSWEVSDNNRVAPLRQEITIDVSAETYGEEPQYIWPTNGVFKGMLFRGGRTWKLTTSVKPNEAATENCGIGASKQTEAIFIPNGGAEYLLDMSRASLVDKKMNLSIADGMLTGIDASQPSQILAGVKIPLTIVQTIAGGLASSIQPIIPLSPAPTPIIAQSNIGNTAPNSSNTPTAATQ